MQATDKFNPAELPRSDIDALAGVAVIEFGTDWCGHCQAAEPLLATVLASYPQVRLLKVEDGKGRKLGRSYGVTLWPTLIFLIDGVEVTRQVRPVDIDDLAQAMALVVPLS
ncbi:MAG: thioredoxin 1 [Burkholderiaceae bacterium]|jgi:thioredoxin 1